MSTMKTEYGTKPKHPVATEPLAQKSVKKAKALKEYKEADAAKKKVGKK